jgi:cytosine/adenosine deaminase-related metal-dependent hydrolase
MNNGVGYAPVVQLARPPLLGTDGIGADMWREARVAEFKSHDAGMSLPFGKSLTFLAESARFASRCLGIKLGVLEPGAAADLVLTDYRPLTPFTEKSLAGHLLFAMGSEYVQSVMVAGQWRLKDRVTVTCDEPSLRSHAVEVARALHDRMSMIQ